MSDEPKASWTKAVPQLLGITALAIVSPAWAMVTQSKAHFVRLRIG
jgi:hypothetical protein